MSATKSNDGESAPGKIVLHEKAFAHLTKGMYRSPASALRELVSNAWDAGAHNVEIRTGFPTFVELSVSDDGDGFDEDEFLRIVQGGLGNSEKRERGPSSTPNRPLIGRLGVGMFGIAQICASFLVSSNPKTGKPFKARVRLYSLLKEELDKPDTPLIRREEDQPLEVHIGEYELLDFDPDEFEGTGTRILADVMHPVFTTTFRDAIKFDDGIPRRDWKEAVTKQLPKYHSLQELGEYFRLIWEISASTPIPYIDNTAVPKGCIKEINEKLLEENFKVYVDGRELRKPVWLRGNKNGYTVTVIPETSATPFKRTVRFNGYIAVQEGLQLRPDELRGLMIRVKGVGIGLYDASLLDYRFNEGPRTRWITGEIYVTEGLEDALNVDRDSFNRFHPQFRYIQKVIHELLRKELFPDVYKQLENRSQRKAKEKQELRIEALSNTVRETFSAKARTSTTHGAPVVVRSIKIKDQTKQVDIKAENADEIATKKSNRYLASSILMLFDLALLQPTKTEMRRTFEEALLMLLRRW